MVTFSPAQYDAVLDGLAGGCSTLALKIAGLPPAAQEALSSALVPPWVKVSIRWLVKKACAVGTWLLEKILELQKGAEAPLWMCWDAWRWSDIRQLTTAVAGVLKETNLSVDDAWKGWGRDAYLKHMKAHSDAAGQCGTIAEKTVLCLGACALAGLAFYVALAVIVVKVIVAFIAAYALIDTLVFSWAGAVAIITESGITAALISAAVATLMACLGTQAAQLAVLHGEATDGKLFPGKVWPKPGSESFSDASMLDGTPDYEDTTDWWLEKKE